MTSKNASVASTKKIPFTCSPIFSGDLNQTPLNGLERASGWNMSFYELVSGVPSTIPYQAQANPFFFYAAAAVNSASFSDLGLTSTSGFASDIVDGGQGRIAFAVSCNATIYDVVYSMIDGNIVAFTAVPSDPRKANIVQAPLQVGFGQYALFQSASSAASRIFISAASNSGAGAGAGGLQTVLASLEKSFSEIGMAAASGAFTYDKNLQQRSRGTIIVTRVPWKPFWFLVVACLLYSLSGIVLFIAACVLQRRHPVRRRQSLLLPRPLPQLLPRRVCGVEWRGRRGGKRVRKAGEKAGEKAEERGEEDGGGVDGDAVDGGDYDFGDGV